MPPAVPAVPVADDACQDSRPNRRVLLAAGLGLCMALPYLAGGPVWDDHTLIVARLAQLDAAGVASLWAHPVGGGQAGGAYFRPVAVTLLSVLGRHGVGAIHVVTALLHAVAAGLVCALSGRDRLALVAAGIFAAHPICAEVLGWASALPDALSVMFGLLGLWCARQGRHTVWVTIIFALSVLSKEAGVVWPLVGFVTGWLDRRTALASGLVVAGLLGLRPLLGVQAVPPVAIAVTEVMGAPLSQLGSLIWPLPLTAVRDTHHLSGAVIGVGALVLVGCVSLAWRFGRLLTGTCLGLVAGPVLALPTVLTSHLAADRYLYLSVACMALMVGALPRTVRLGQRLETRAARWVLGALVLAAASVHVSAGQMWRSDVALFQQAAVVMPVSSYAHYFAGHAYAKAGSWAAAVEHFEASSSLSHPHPLGTRYALEAMVRGGDASAAVAFARASPKDGLTAEWLAWWAQAELDAGHAERALGLVQKLRQGDGSWDGPAFVAQLAEDAREQAIGSAEVQE